ncbi:MAG: PEP/pyruvate-binding domain-containing protein [Desulfobacterales bacterium]
MKRIIGIHDQEEDSLHCFGSKGLRLKELAGLGFEVPDGFLISVEGISWLVSACGMDQYISEVISSEAAGASNLEETVKNTFQKIKPEDTIFHQLMERIIRIRGFHPEMHLAVRSAAVGEDDGAASYAGQYSTVLGVSPENLLNAIFECYASWWSDRVMAYRRQKGIAPCEPHLSVIVQRQLLAEFAGVLFTRHPLSGKKDTVLVESVVGLGDKLVSGEVTPSRWEISEKSGITSIASQQRTSEQDIGEKNLRRLYDIGNKLERHFDRGIDMEWAIEKNRVYVLQARPITSGVSHPETELPEPARAPVDWAENIYSRAIIEDLWADRMSEITGSIVFDEFADLFTFKPILRKLKLNDIADKDIVKVINGYGYLSSQAVAMILELVPRSLRFREISRIFPVSIQKQILDTPFNWKKAIGLIPRIPFLITDPAMIPLFTRHFLKKHLIAIETELNRVDVHSYQKMTMEELSDELERVLRLQGKLQERNQWAYGNATLFTWLLRHLATNFFKKSEQWVLEQITHIPSNVTVRSQQQLKSICRMCDEKLLEKAFRGKNGMDTWKILSSEFPTHPVTRAIQAFVKTYRFRSSNRDFIHPRWDEAPEIVVSMMSVIIGSMKENSEKAQHFVSSSQMNSTRNRNSRMIPSIFLLAPLVNAARKFLALREDLRYCLDKIFYRIRKILISISNTPQFNSLNDIPDSVFFITLPELRAFFSGKTVVDSLHSEIKRRRQTFYQEQDRPPAYCIRMNKSSETIMTSADSSATILSGIPASSGVVEGVARVIRHTDEFHLLKPGEILVAFNTDPGWTPLFMSAAGVIVEMGGILNHCAIVAREYGIPAVVGIEQVSRKIETGRKIRLDGNSGVVELL